MGVSENATLQQIKTAYRRKAKTLHPDVNKSPGAKEKFIELDKAYDYLVGVKTGKIRPGQTRTRRKSPQPRKKTAEEIRAEKIKERREKAQEFARRREEAYKKSDLYKRTQAFYLIMGYFSLIIPLAGFSLALILLLWDGILAAITILVLTGLGSMFWWPALKNFRKRGFEGAIPAIKILWAYPKLRYNVSLVVNFILFLSFTLDTMVSTKLLVLLLVFLMLCAWLIPVMLLRKRSGQVSSLWWAWIPTAFNLFFFVNYTFSGDQHYEMHKYELIREVDPSSGATTGYKAYVHLEDHRYQEVFWMRYFFYDFGLIARGNVIKYDIERGLFGLRVVKGYTLYRINKFGSDKDERQLIPVE